MKKRIGVLLSGRGSNFEALAESVAAGRVSDAEIAIVIANREGTQGIERARTRGIATREISSRGFEREAYDRQIVAVFKSTKSTWCASPDICACCLRISFNAFRSAS